MESAREMVQALSHFLTFDGTRGYKIFVVVSFPVWITTIAIGATYVNDCPLQKFLPIFLLIAGFVMTVKCILNIAQWMSCGDPQEDGTCMHCMPIDFIMIFFFFLWTLVGNYWLQDAFTNLSFIKGDPDYCNETLCWYTLSFVIACDLLTLVRIIWYCRCSSCEDTCPCCMRQSYVSINNSSGV